MRKYLQDIGAVADRTLTGLPVSWSIVDRRGDHPFVQVTTCDGRARKVFFPGSSGDWRVTRNFRRNLRKVCRELGLETEKAA